MPESIQALAVVLVAVLPGALYTWAFEREIGRWGIGLADRILRFIGASVIFQILFAVPLYAVDSQYAHHKLLVRGTADLEQRVVGEERWQLFAGALIYVAAPFLPVPPSRMLFTPHARGCAASGASPPGVILHRALGTPRLRRGLRRSFAAG